MYHILSVNHIEKLSSFLQKEHKKVVLVGGCFDIIHIGHTTLLEGAKAHGDSVVVFLESDKRISQLKGTTRPIHTQQQRAQVLTALKAVDYVVLLPDSMENEDYDKLTNLLQPAIIATTENDPGIVHKKRQAEKTGAKLVFVNKPIQNVSTSTIISALQSEL